MVHIEDKAQNLNHNTWFRVLILPLTGYLMIVKPFNLIEAQFLHLKGRNLSHSTKINSVNKKSLLYALRDYLNTK